MPMQNQSAGNRATQVLPSHHARILVVEDNPVTRKMVRLTLRAEGYDVLEAVDGKSAREWVTRVQPDLILLDWMLPDASGHDLVKEFRATPNLAETPILCFSGFVSRVEEVDTAGSGFTDFLVKPVEPHMLVLMVRNYLPHSPRQYAGQGRGRRVLIVDDDPVQLKLLRLVYAYADFDIHVAHDGNEAIAIAESYRPDIIVSDILMLGMDGFQLCHAIRQHPTLNRTRVLLISAHYVEAPDREFAEGLGANAYVAREDGLESILKLTLDTLASDKAPTVTVQGVAALDMERHQRLERQLERQVDINTACITRASVQSTILHELSLVSEILARHTDFVTAMEEILAHCMNGAGLSKGAIYLREGSELQLFAQYGLADSVERAQQIFGACDFCERIARENDPVSLPNRRFPVVQGDWFLERANAKSALLVPIRSPQESLGLLMMYSSYHDLLEADWHAFGRSLAGQIAQTVVLSRTYFTLGESERRYRMLFEGASDGIIITDENLQVIDLNPAVTRLSGRVREDLQSRPVYEALTPPAFHAKLERFLEDFRREGVLREEFPIVSRWGQTRQVQVSITRVAKDLAVNILHDVTEARLAYEMVQRLAYTDILTDLANRTMLDTHLLKTIHAAETNHTTFALLIMDMVDFRVINDTLGHQNGDLLLVQIAGRLKSALWENDLIARLGGDEFAVVLTRLAQPQHVDIVIQKIGQAMLEPFVVADISIDVQMAIGVAIYPEHADNVDTLMRRADIAMYAARDRQQGSATYSVELDRTDTQQLGLLSELRQAIHADQLVLHYQPVIDAVTGKPVGMEALVRWPSPTRGMIYPDKFIPVAEHTGLIHSLTLWVLRKSLQQLNVWREAAHDLYMSVNLSVRDLQHANIVEEILQLLADCNIPPPLLTLEITETAVMVDPTHAQTVLGLLRGHGIKLSVDDFGTGHAALAYLKTLPLHKLKVDKSFVMDLHDDGNAAIVLSVIQLAHRLNLDVTAEGVEDQYSLDQLKLFGCDTVQGYFISRPIPAEAMTDWLRQRPPVPA